MTRDHKSDQDQLADLFASARRESARPSVDFMARVEQDAQDIQASFAPASKPAKKRSGWQWVMPQWRPLAGLAACLVFGIGLGGGFSMQLSLLGTEYLSGETLSSGELFLVSYDEVLMTEEG